MKTLSSVEAQNNFGRLLDIVQREPVTITRHGRVAAFLVSPEDMRELREARGSREASADAFEAFFAASDARLTPDARELSESDVAKLVRESR